MFGVLASVFNTCASPTKFICPNLDFFGGPATVLRLRTYCILAVPDDTLLRGGRSPEPPSVATIAKFRLGLPLGSGRVTVPLPSGLKE